jgi:membrane-associated phospholipid phosphatase
VTVLPLATLASWHSVGDRSVATSVTTLILTTSIGPCLFIYGAYLAGSISSPDLPRRSERLQPALFATLCAAAAYPLLRMVGASGLFLSVDAALTLQLALLAIVTIWWKISYHAASAAGLAAVALALGDTTVGLPLAALAVLVGWARVRLHRHTAGQVVAGWASALPALWWAWPG